MKFVLSKIAIASICSCMLFSASLQIYQDSVQYRFIPTENFLGFVNADKALCEDTPVSIVSDTKCPKENSLCQEYEEIKDLKLKLDTLKETQEVLNTLVASVKPEGVEATKWIDASELIGNKRAKLKKDFIMTKKALVEVDRDFTDKTTSKEPKYLKEPCHKELKLTLPSGCISGRLEYELDIADKKHPNISRYLILKNRCGIDILAKNAQLYNRPSKRYLAPKEFRPWVVRPESKKKKYLKKRANPNLSLMTDMVAPTPRAMEAGIKNVSRTGYKSYSIGRLSLPSNNKEIKVRLSQEKFNSECNLVSYPYIDKSVYLACRFRASMPIESNKWIIKSGNTLLTDNARGRYEGKDYLIYVMAEEALKVTKRDIVEKDKVTGIFGSYMKRKDGYILSVTNYSLEPKSIKIIERIPTPTSDKIKVKLLLVEGAVSKKVTKEGKLILNVAVGPKESKEVKVLFELEYPKDMHILY